MIKLYWYRGPDYPSEQYKDNSGVVWNKFYNEKSTWPCYICGETCFKGFMTHWLGKHQMACSKHFKEPFDIEFLKYIIHQATLNKMSSDDALTGIAELIHRYEAD